MKFKGLYGLFEDARGDKFLVPMKLNAVKKINGKVLEASVLLRIVDGVKKWSKRTAKP